MKGYHLVLGVILSLGLGSGYALLPSDQHLALMHLKDKDFDKARMYYERLLAAGELSIPVVVPLSQLYLAYGDVDKAVKVMERFVQAHPDHAQARKQLGVYLQYAQRTDEYQLNLELLSKAAPTQENLMDLAKIHNFNAQYDKQILVLRRVVELYPENPDNFVNLARLMAAQHLYADAVAVLKELRTRHPKAMTLELTELLTSLLLDTGAPEEALVTARHWLEREKNLDQVVRLTSLIHFRGFPTQGLKLIRVYEPHIMEHTGVLKELTLLQVANGEQEAAWKRLVTLFEMDQLPEDMFENFIDLSLTRGDLEMAMAGLRRARITSLPEWLLASLGKVAQEQGASRYVDEIWTLLGEDYFEANPVLAASLALTREDRDAAVYWVAKAETSLLTLHQQLRLAVVYVGLRQEFKALALLASLARLPDTPESSLVELAHLYVKLDRSEVGIPLYRELRATRSSRSLEEGLLLMLASRKQEEEVLPALAGLESPGVAFLADLHFVAMGGGAYRVALASAERLAQVDPSPRVQVMVANATLKNGDSRAALTQLRSLLPGSTEVENAYLEALVEVRKQDPALREELRHYLSGRLERTDLLAQERERDVYLMYQWVGHGEALPHVRPLALTLGGDWISPYEETLKELKQRGELLAYWKKSLQDPTLETERRRQIGFGLLQENEKGMGQEVFAALARQATADHPDVLQYLFLLGPRPPAAQVAWIRERAEKAEGADRGGWLRHLVNVGETEAARALAISRLPATQRDDPVLREAALEVLSLSSNKEGLLPLLKTEVQHEHEPERLKRLGALAEATAHNTQAIAAYGRILAQKPDDPHALRRTGYAAFFDGDRSRVVEALTRYIALTGGDYESHFYLAETLWFQKKIGLAREHFSRALALLEGMSAPLPLALATNRARILTRLGRDIEAKVYYEELLRQYPKDLALQGDYAELLLLRKEHQRLHQFQAHGVEALVE